MTPTRPQPARSLPFDEARTGRFEAYAAAYRTVFHRADQALRFRSYLRGLLEPGGQKNVEGVAAAGQVMMVEASLPQALQHFVSNSPWDARPLHFPRLRQVHLRPRIIKAFQPNAA